MLPGGLDIGVTSNAHIVAWMFLLSRLPVWGAMPRLIGEKLRHLRLQKGLTQVDLARQIGLASHSHVAKVEAGKDTVSLSLVMRIARLLGVSTDYLLRDALPIENPLAFSASVRSNNEAQSFASQLRRLRVQRQLSQRALARQLGLASPTYIGILEADRGKLPSLELVVRIADFFGITTDDLLRGALAWMTDHPSEETR
jgi:transcriptional regulator with XRE-family HTH domain